MEAGHLLMLTGHMLTKVSNECTADVLEILNKDFLFQISWNFMFLIQNTMSLNCSGGK